MKNLQRIFLLFWLLAGLAACGPALTPTATAVPTQPPTPTFVPSPTPIPPTITPVPTALPTEETAVFPAGNPANPPTYSYEIVNAYPHDTAAFTEGLVYLDGFLYEGVGLYKHSSIRKTSLETGEILQIHDLAPEYFGEGITIWQDRLIQLTWKSGTGFIYDLASFAPLDSFAYPGEGWGLTHDGEQLIMSDGTNEIRFLDPETLAENGRIQVQDPSGPVVRLNELEYIHGEIWANVWQTNRIARIDPATGQVLAWVDLTGLLSPALITQPVDVLNGIAYDAAGDRLFVTGKWWPRLYEIKLTQDPKS